MNMLLCQATTADQMLAPADAFVIILQQCSIADQVPVTPLRRCATSQQQPPVQTLDAAMQEATKVMHRNARTEHKAYNQMQNPLQIALLLDSAYANST